MTDSFPPAICRGARGLLGWTQEDLARHAKVGVTTIRNFEAGRSTPIANNQLAIRGAMAAAGIEFLPDRGIRLSGEDHKQS